MPLMLTLLPIEWTRHAGIGEAIAYSVCGLPPDNRAVISMCPGGWRIVRDALVEFDQRRLYASAEEALVDLKGWLEGGEMPKGE